MFDDLPSRIASAFAIASFIYGLFGVIVLLDDDHPGKWLKIAVWVAVSWPILWGLANAAAGTW